MQVKRYFRIYMTWKGTPEHEGLWVIRLSDYKARIICMPKTDSYVKKLCKRKGMFEWHHTTRGSLEKLVKEHEFVKEHIEDNFIHVEELTEKEAFVYGL